MARRNTYLFRILPVFIFAFLGIKGICQPKLIINEVSQGTSAKEYVELLVMGTPSCSSSNCMDLRGFYIDDNNGFYAAGGSVGIAPGIVRFTQDPRWACVPFGTLIVVYNDIDVNLSLPPDDLSMTDGNCRMIIPANDCSLFERHTSAPTGSNSTIPTSGFIPCGSWSTLAMSNGGDSFQVINPTNLTTAEFAVSYANNQSNTMIYFNVTMGNSVMYNANLVDNNPFDQANWTYGVVPTFETPGSPNNAANSAWISQMNNNCSPFPAPVITSTSTDETCNCNGTATVTVTGGIRPYTYSWDSGITSTDSLASGLCEGSYIVNVTAANGCVVSDTIEVNSSASISITTNKNDLTCNGSSDGTAAVTVSGGTGLSYTWNPPVSSTANASNLSPGTYTVTVSESGGCGVTNSFVITEPVALSVQTAYKDASCFGTCNGEASVLSSGGTAPYSYSWSTGQTTDSVTGLCAGQVCVRVTDANGCFIDTCLTLLQPDAIQLTVTTSNSTCNLPTGSASVNVSGGNSPYTYSWTGGSTSNTASSLTPGLYCITVTDSSGCVDSVCVNVGNTPGVSSNLAASTNASCFNDCNGTALVSSSGGQLPYTYSWLPISSTGPDASSLCQGTYTAMVTDASSCKDTVHVIITEPDELIVIPVIPATLCIGEDVTLTATTSGGTGTNTLTWSPQGPLVSPDTTSTYTVSAIDQNGCSSATYNVTVNVFQPLNISVNTPLPVCPGGSVTLSTSVNGGNGAYNYSWIPTGNTTASLTLSPAVEGTYTVVVTDGCTTPPDTAVVEVVINNASPVSFTVDTTSGCVPFCVTLTDHTPGSVNSIWTIDGVTKSGSVAEFCFDEPGQFDLDLSVNGANGCSGVIHFDEYFTSFATPAASFTASSSQVTIFNPTVEFINTSQDASMVEWFISDSVYTRDSILYTFADTGCYNIFLKAYSTTGCYDSTEKEVCVKDDYAVYIPNAFSPNGDGTNDTFGPIGNGIASSDFLFQIFDRWGNLVFQSTDHLKNWNGKSNNGSSTSVEDVYVYKVRILDTSGNLHTYKGSVTLVK